MSLKISLICLILLTNLNALSAVRMRPLRAKGSTVRAVSEHTALKSIALTTGMSVTLLHPRVVEAVTMTSSKATEALQLLDGYQTRTDPNVTWTVLLAGGTWLLFEIYKGLANW